MRRPLFFKTIIFTIVILVPQFVFAGAYYFPQIGARASTMGNAFVAVSDDASAVFHNPAGMTQIEEAEGNYFFALAFPDFTYQREANGQTYATEYQQMRVMTPFYLGYVSPMKKYKGTSGFALYNAWGGLPKWREEAPSRYVLKHNYLVALHTTYSIGWPLTDYFSVGGGLSLVYCYNQQRKSVDFQDLAGEPAAEDYYNEMDVLITGDGWAFGGNASAMLTLFDDLRLGITYTPQVTFNIDATMKSTTPFLLSALTPTMTLNANITLILPQTVRGGISYRFSDRLTAAFDVQWVDWSVIKDTNVNFPKGEFFIEERDHIAIPRLWRDSYTFNLGFEYEVNWWEGATLRAGYTYDEWAIPERTMMIDNPDANKHAISVGTSYRYNDKMVLDFGYEIRLFDDRHVTNSIYAEDDPAIVGGVANGYYKETLHLVYLDIRMRGD